MICGLSQATTPLAVEWQRVGRILSNTEPGDCEVLHELTSAAAEIAARLGWSWTVTSFRRPGRTRHAFGEALDVSFRSGPLAQDRQRGFVNYYMRRGFIDALVDALEVDSPAFDHLERVVIEMDHLHLDYSARPVFKPGVSIYAPGRCHSFSCEVPLGPTPIVVTEPLR
jgi:hypothetical protein